MLAKGLGATRGPFRSGETADGGDDRYSGGAATATSHSLSNIPAAWRRSTATASSGWNSPEPLPLAAGFAWIEQLPGRAGRAACRLLRLRTAVAGAVHRHRVHRIQPPLRRYAAAMGRDEERRATTRWRAATSFPPLHKPAEPSFHAFCFARPAAGAAGSFVIAGSGEAGDGPAPYQRAHGALWRNQPRRDAREGAVRARAHGGAHGGTSARPGPTRLRRRSIRCTIFIRFWPTRSSGAALRSTG